jgi:hypothetical protein
MAFLKEMNYQLSEEENKDVPMDFISREFIIKLVNYIDSRFPQYGGFDNDIYNEIRKYMDETDSKQVKKIKEKVHNIVIKEKVKFLKRIQNSVEKLQVPKKGENNG